MVTGTTRPPTPPGMAMRRRPGTSGPPNRRDGRRPAETSDLRHRFAGLLLATLTGQRPAAGLLGLVSGEVYEKVWELVQRGVLRHPPRTPAPKVLRCRHSAPGRGVLEVSAVVHVAGRPRALAFRLENPGGRRWRCTALEVG